MMKKELRYNIVFKSEPEGGFTVAVPALPGCVTYGKDIEEAKKMAKDAILGYVISLKKHKEPVPNDEGSFFATLGVNISLTYA